MVQIILKQDTIINDECKKMKKILISAAISKFDGHYINLILKKSILL